jgi:hypothetical protein
MSDFFSKICNSNLVKKAPWLLYMFIAFLAGGIVIMCIRLSVGDDITASIAAGFVCCLILVVCICLWVSLKQVQSEDLNGTARPRKKRVTVCLKSHFFDETAEKETTCPICLVDLSSNDKVVTLDCDHVFHVDCISSWTKRVAVCPACRFTLPVTVSSACTTPGLVEETV